MLGLMGSATAMIPLRPFPIFSRPWAERTVGHRARCSIGKTYRIVPTVPTTGVAQCAPAAGSPPPQEQTLEAVMKRYLAILPMVVLLAGAAPAFAGNSNNASAHKADEMQERNALQGTNLTLAV